MFTGEDMRGKHPPAHKMRLEVFESVKAHIYSFLVVESHYCLASTKRKIPGNKILLLVRSETRWCQSQFPKLSENIWRGIQFIILQTLE